MGKLIKLQNSNRPDEAKESAQPIQIQRPLNDAVAAFTFSRLPREERIATILLEILRKHDPTAVTTFTFTGVEGPAQLLEIGKDLAEYSVRDFAVRYGHLEDGERTGVYGKKV